ncbi:MAG: aminotransferase class V-fold PLP-dependent enzyme [Cyclobacteriaceae bacterium]
MKCQRNKFRLKRKDVYLNCAYMSPLLKKVENAGIKGISQKRQPHKISPNDFFDDTQTIRKLFSELVNCTEPERMAIIPSVSYGMANITKNLSIDKHENIVVVGDQFPSNIYPWMRLCDDTNAELKIVYPPDSFENRGEKWNQEILVAIDESTIAVCIGHVHWADGTLFHLENIRKRCDNFGALLIIDGTQSVGALPFDIEKIKPDALVCAAYKWLFGPYSIGIAYYGSTFDEGKPIEENWINRNNSEDFANLVNYQREYRTGALKYAVGEHSNFVLTPMFLESIKQIRKWGPANIQEYCKKLINPFVKELRDIGLFIENDNKRSAHLFGVRCEKDKLDKLKKSFKKNRISVSFRGEFVRVSPSVYNYDLDMRRLVKSFTEVL